MDAKTRLETLSLSHSTNLDVILPQTPKFDAEAWFGIAPGQDVSLIPSRRNLFFDEQVELVVILRTSKGKLGVAEILSELELTFAAHVTEAVPQGSGNAASASGKHEINSDSVPASTFTNIFASGDKTYVIWKPKLHLSRPRARLQRPAIYFTVALSSRDAAHNAPRRGEQDFLRSYEPLPANVLEPFQFDPVLQGSHVFLSEAKVIKVAPKTPGFQDIVKPIRSTSKRAFPAMPALFSKIRYCPSPDAIIACLSLEVSHVIAGKIVIDDIFLNVTGGSVEHLTNTNLLEELRGGDETIALYRIKPLNEAAYKEIGTSSRVSVSIAARASPDQGPDITFQIKWQTQVDLSQKLPKPLYRWSRPMSTFSSRRRGQSTQSNPGHVSFEEARRHVEGEAGVTFSFTCPTTVVKDADFRLTVQCNNRSGRTRRLALHMEPPTTPKLFNQSHSSTTSTDHVTRILETPSVEPITFLDVIDLNSDVRIGPLPSGACFETHLEFRAVKTGILDLGVLRIVDLDTRQTVDVRELPDVAAIEKSHLAS